MSGKVIKSKFTTDANLAALFGGRLFPAVGAQGQTTPYAIYEVINNSPTRSKDSDSHIDEIDVRITLVSTNYSDTATGVDNVRSAFVRTLPFKVVNLTENGICFQTTNDFSPSKLT